MLLVDVHSEHIAGRAVDHGVGGGAEQRPRTVVPVTADHDEIRAFLRIVVQGIGGGPVEYPHPGYPPLSPDLL